MESRRLVEAAFELAASLEITTLLVQADELRDVRQLVLNPCQGHPKKNRNIHAPEFFETLREFAAIDGAFIIDNRGVVEAAGAYIDALVKNAKLYSGLGARHAAAAAITAVTDAISVAVSASSGTVTVFRKGRAILELEKPVPHPQ